MNIVKDITNGWHTCTTSRNIKIYSMWAAMNICSMRIFFCYFCLLSIPNSTHYGSTIVALPYHKREIKTQEQMDEVIFSRIASSHIEIIAFCIWGGVYILSIFGSMFKMLFKVFIKLWYPFQKFPSSRFYDFIPVPLCPRATITSIIDKMPFLVRTCWADTSLQSQSVVLSRKEELSHPLVCELHSS